MSAKIAVIYRNIMLILKALKIHEFLFAWSYFKPFNIKTGDSFILDNEAGLYFFDVFPAPGADNYAAAKVIVHFHTLQGMVISRLTDHELNLLEKLNLGKTQAEIAREMKLTPQAVHNLLASVRKKLTGAFKNLKGEGTLTVKIDDEDWKEAEEP